MSKLYFNEHVYNLGQLIELRRISPLYKSGDVCDLETGETVDISEIDKFRDLYIDELLPTKDKLSLLNKKDKTHLLKLYEKKFAENRITKLELLELIKLKSSRYFEIDYDDYFIKNAEQPKPEELSISDYGRFMMLLDLMSYKNIIQHSSNGKQIKKTDIMKYLEIENDKSFTNFLGRLCKVGMIARNGVRGKRFIHINPIYAKRKIKIDQTIYDLFKDDLAKYLDEYEIAYFEMESKEAEDEDILSATLEILQD